ncbi:MAG: hypothetical protein RMN25_14230, partial [Anaerolineae bacterium]|nr:hypothetical protein [Thermoflexales bacterium]MDW8408927.1 hypothetical protein [Anaerolineae bacterium]
TFKAQLFDLYSCPRTLPALRGAVNMRAFSRALRYVAPVASEADRATFWHGACIVLRDDAWMCGAVSPFRISVAGSALSKEWTAGEIVALPPKVAVAALPVLSCGNESDVTVHFDESGPIVLQCGRVEVRCSRAERVPITASHIATLNSWLTDAPRVILNENALHTAIRTLWAVHRAGAPARLRLCDDGESVMMASYDYDGSDANHVRTSVPCEKSPDGELPEIIVNTRYLSHAIDGLGRVAVTWDAQRVRVESIGDLVSISAFATMRKKDAECREDQVQDE